MDPYKETFETWNQIAAIYQEKFMDLDLYNHTYDRFCEALKNDSACVLEIGCGPGNITRYLLGKKPALSVLGLDVAPNMIALAKANNPKAEFRVMDCRDLHKLSGPYDGIVCGFCLPYLSFSDCEKLIADCSGLLKPRTVLYLSFVEGPGDNSGFQSGSTGQRAYFHYHSLPAIRQLLFESGFEEPEIIKLSYQKSDEAAEIHTILIASRI